MKHKIHYFAMAILVISCLPVPRANADAIIYITAVQVTGGSGHTDQDFIELFNPNAEPFNLKGYRLVKRAAASTSDTLIKSWTVDTFIPAQSFYLWANSGFTSIPVAPDLTTAGTLADNNGVAARLGANDSGTIIDSIAWDNADNSFSNVSSDNPGPNQSLVRTDVQASVSAYQIQDSQPRNSAVFDIPLSPPVDEPAAYPPADPGDEPPPAADPPVDDSAPPPAESTGQTGDPPAQDNQPLPPEAADPPSVSPPTTYLDESTSVKINELLPNPAGADSGQETVELKNFDSQTVSLDGWLLDDESATGPQDSAYQLQDIVLDPGQLISIIIPEGHFSLNNTGGDAVNLYFADKSLADSVAYSDSAAENQSYQKLGDSWVWGLPSPGADNAIVQDPGPGQTSNGSGGGSADDGGGSAPPPDWALVISELLPDPDSGQDEFVEIFNSGSLTVNLKNIKLKVGSRSKTLPDYDLEPGSFYLVEEDDLPLHLSNNGTTVAVLDVYKRMLSSVSYQKTAGGQALALSSTGEYLWTEAPTPTEANSIVLAAITVSKSPAPAKKTPATKAKTASASKPKTAAKASAPSNSTLPDQGFSEVFEANADPPVRPKPKFPYFYFGLSLVALAVLGGAWKFRDKIF